jgi:hypothetical protein
MGPDRTAQPLFGWEVHVEIDGPRHGYLSFE